MWIEKEAIGSFHPAGVVHCYGTAYLPESHETKNKARDTNDDDRI
jgi:hypothetical protein